MVDAALGSPPPVAEGEGWRDGLALAASAYHDVLRGHPWALGPDRGPGGDADLHRLARDGLSLGDTGLPEAEKLSVMLLLSGYVRNEATLAASMAPAAEAGEIMPTWGRLLGQLTTPEDFPALHAALGSAVFAQDDEPDDEFVFGLERVLDGVAALVAQRARRRLARSGSLRLRADLLAAELDRALEQRRASSALP